MIKSEDKIYNGSYWFKRFQRDAKKISTHIHFKRIKYGYYRIYWMGGGENAYLGECSKEMPETGYDIEEKDIQLESRKYFEEYEDQIELTNKIQNFVDGYWEQYNSLKTKVYQMKHDKEFYKTTTEGYRTMRVI
jgi:hypothetical protein